MSEFMIALIGEYPAHLESWLKAKATEAIKQAVASEIESSEPWPWAKKPYEQFYAVKVYRYPHHPAGKTDLSLRSTRCRGTTTTRTTAAADVWCRRAAA